MHALIGTKVGGVAHVSGSYRLAHGLIQSRLAHNIHLTFKIVANKMYSVLT